MAENLEDKIKMENIEIKEEIQEDILPSSTVEDTCTVNIKEEDVKNEFLGKFSFNTNLLVFFVFNLKRQFFGLLKTNKLMQFV